eukprot:CAMPEP_0198322432 /NCGR_PEP_ID=MMETSP1450-20131203/10912_1 /TAXON_ID=753684 ORGANISM="Madagascaria erythrocladiodes, Strain CCMP3234" /NCGR_SAMPLE_ID=MMETSP1450 /ASSEMBLY_ACC=CAM_ASM_001115 /LENGTH=242 /DNA_ID=CAMNT_0044026047 /DNA_START=98 /DNA_END=826 /DNA_ORIENTATION=+
MVSGNDGQYRCQVVIQREGTALIAVCQGCPDQAMHGMPCQHSAKAALGWRDLVWDSHSEDFDRHLGIQERAESEMCWPSMFNVYWNRHISDNELLSVMISSLQSEGSVRKSGDINGPPYGELRLGSGQEAGPAAFIKRLRYQDLKRKFEALYREAEKGGSSGLDEFDTELDRMMRDSAFIPGPKRLAGSTKGIDDGQVVENPPGKRQTKLQVRAKAAEKKKSYKQRQINSKILAGRRSNLFH